MHMKYRSILTAILILTCMFSRVAAEDAQPVVQAEKSGEVIQLLSALGITDSVRTPDDRNMSRMEFLALAIHAAGWKEAVSGVSGCSAFSDVNPDDYGAKYLQVGLDVGIVTGGEDGLFHPEDEITTNDAVNILQRCLGYAKNGIPANASVQKELLSNISSQISHKLTYAQACEMVFHFLKLNDTTTFHEGLDGTAGVKSIEKTVLENRHKTIEKQGKITAVEHAALPGNDAAKSGYIGVDFQTYASEIDVPQIYLGAHGTVYYWVGGDEPVIISVFCNNNNREIYKILDENIVSVLGFDKKQPGGPQLAYYDEAGRLKTADISEGAAVVYNGVSVFEVHDSMLEVDCGCVVLLDNNMDNIYDGVQIYSYEQYVVSSVSLSNLLVMDRNGRIPLELKNCAPEDLIIKKDGVKVDFAAIKTNDVLAVRARHTDSGEIDCNQPIYIDISSAYVEGAVSEIQEGSANVFGKIKIDDTWYDIEKSCQKAFAIGDSGTFVLGHNDRVVGFISGNQTGMNSYSLLEAVEKKGGLSDDLSIKVFNQNNQENIYSIAEPVLYTGDYGGQYVTGKKVEPDQLYNLLCPGASFSPSLVQLQISESGAVEEIIMPVDPKEYDENYKLYDNDIFSLEFTNSTSRIWNNICSDIYQFDSSTKVFVRVTGNDGEVELSVGAYTRLPEDIYVDQLMLYDSNEKMTVSAALITCSEEKFYEPSENFLRNTPIFLVDSVTTAIDSNGETKIKLVGYSEGVKTSVMPQDNTLTDRKLTSWNTIEKSKWTEIERGDIIQYRLNSEGYADMLHVLYDFDKDKMDRAESFENEPASGYLASMRTVYGRVQKNMCNEAVEVEAIVTKQYPLLHKYAYIYDLERDRITVADQSAYIQDEQSGEGDYIFLRLNRNSLQEIVLFR